MHILRKKLTTALLELAEGERKYVARPGIKPRTSDLRVMCPTDCATRPGRANKDRLRDYNGRIMLKICKLTGLLIANSRLFEDQPDGKFTFCSQHGQSTANYLLLNLSDLDTLSSLYILEFNKLSDHMPFNFNIDFKSRNKTETCRAERETHTVTTNSEGRPKGY